MNSINQVELLGNVTRDVELKMTKNGTETTEVSIATNRSVKKGNEWTSIVEFHNIILWGKKADVAARYLKKGNKVFFRGRLQTSSWVDKAGKKIYKTEIIGDEMILLTPKPKDQETTKATDDVKAAFPGSEELTADDAVDDLPF